MARHRIITICSSWDCGTTHKGRQHKGRGLRRRLSTTLLVPRVKIRFQHLPRRLIDARDLLLWLGGLLFLGYEDLHGIAAEVKAGAE